MLLSSWAVSLLIFGFSSALSPPYESQKRGFQNDSSPTEFVGCNATQQSSISMAFQDAIRMAKNVGSINLTNDVAAIEFFGPQKFWNDSQIPFSNIFGVVANYPWTISAYCTGDAQTVAQYCSYPYVGDLVSRGTPWENGTASSTNSSLHILFCEKFFAQPTIDERIQEVTGNSSGSSLSYLDNYSKNTGSSLLRVLLHSPLVPSPFATNVPIRDLYGVALTYTTDMNARISKTLGGHIPAISKLFARTTIWNGTGYWLLAHVNAPNYVLYALTTYVQKQIGRYPWLPLLTVSNSTTPIRDYRLAVTMLSTQDRWALNLTSLVSASLDSTSVGVCNTTLTCGISDGIIAENDNIGESTLTDSRWLTDNDYPAEYLQQRDEFIQGLQSNQSAYAG